MKFNFSKNRNSNKIEVFKYINSLFVVIKFKEIFNPVKVLLKYYKFIFDFKKLDKLVFITGASSSHQKSLLKLIESINIYVPDSEIYVFDLGLQKHYRDILENINLKFKLNILKYNFGEKPRWMNIGNNNKGFWAWKSDCIKIVESIYKNKDPNTHVTFIWFDAGNKMVGNPVLVQRYIQKYGFWSAASTGKVKDWTFHKTIDLVIGDQKFNDYENLNGAMLGFNTRNKIAMLLLEEWWNLSKNKELIAPKGSNRLNHRQDQSLLTLLAYKLGIAPTELGLRIHFDSILQHQDID